MNFAPFCVILTFLSASKVTVSPGFTSCVAAPDTSPFAVVAAMAFQPALLMASVTFSTVAICLPAAVFAAFAAASFSCAFCCAAVSPALVASANSLVASAIALSSAVVALPVDSVAISPVFTFTPFAPTVIVLSAGLTEIVLPVVSFCKPLPTFTSYFTFTLPVVPSLSTDTVVPLPFKKFTCSSGLMVSTSVLLFPATFQPLAFNWLTFTASLSPSPFATLVILVGLVPSALVTFKLSPSRVIFGPLSPN